MSDICTAAIASLFDHVVGAQQHSSRDVEADCFGNLEVDNQIKLSRLLNRQVRWLRALGQLVNIISDTAKHYGHVRSVRQYAASVYKLAEPRNSRHSLLRGKFADAV